MELGGQGKCPNSISMWHGGSLSTTSDDAPCQLTWLEIGVLKANAVAIVLKLANTPYQDLMVSVARFLCLLWWVYLQLGCFSDCWLETSPAHQMMIGSMHSNLLSIVWVGDSFDEAGRKKAVELKAVEVLVPYLNHVDSHVIAYAAAALIRYNHNKIVHCCIWISKKQEPSRKRSIDNMGSHIWIYYV